MRSGQPGSGPLSSEEDLISLVHEIASLAGELGFLRGKRKAGSVTRSDRIETAVRNMLVHWERVTDADYRYGVPRKVTEDYIESVQALRNAIGPENERGDSIVARFAALRSVAEELCEIDFSDFDSSTLQPLRFALADPDAAVAEYRAKVWNEAIDEVLTSGISDYVSENGVSNHAVIRTLRK